MNDEFRRFLVDLFGCEFNRSANNVLYRALYNLLKTNPDVEFETKNIKNGTVIRRSK